MTGRGFLIAANNWLVQRVRRPRVAPDCLLVLLPRCLQRSGCDRDVTADLASCRRCGRCDLAALLALCEETGARFVLAGGGREAARLVRQPGVRAVVACACEKEMVEGIRAAFPKPVLGVLNRTPEGFCRNTGGDVAQVRAAIRSLIGALPRP